MPLEVYEVGYRAGGWRLQQRGQLDLWGRPVPFDCCASKSKDDI
jgi:hypothetical protein